MSELTALRFELQDVIDTLESVMPIVNLVNEKYEQTMDNSFYISFSSVEVFWHDLMALTHDYRVTKGLKVANVICKRSE